MLCYVEVLYGIWISFKYLSCNTKKISVIRDRNRLLPFQAMLLLTSVALEKIDTASFAISPKKDTSEEKFR
jgi:hypothetical protein